MSDRSKKAIFIAIFIAIVLGTGYLLYRLFFLPVISPAPVPGNVAVNGQLPTAGVGVPQPGVNVAPTGPGTGLPVTPEVPTPGAPTIPYVPPGGVAPSRTIVLSEQRTQAISKNPSGNGVRVFNPTDGKFYRILDDGTLVPLSDNVFFNVSNVTWGKQSDKAILEYPDGTKTYYDFSTDKQVTLPNYWEDFDFAPQDQQIVAKSNGNNDTARFLIVSNPDGTNARPIAELGDQQDKVFASWSPNNQTVAYSLTGDPIGYDRQSILLIGQHQENFKDLVVEGRGFIPLWSPSGNNLLYSVYSSNEDYKPMLWVSGAAGDSVNAHRQSIGINTWADKCAWQSEQVIICAVPDQIPGGAGLQRDALMGNIPDHLYRLDLSSGTKVDLGIPDGNPTINQMTLSSDGQAVYYTEANTGRLLRFSVAP